MRHVAKKILSPDALADVRNELRQRGETVVQCHGCFDIVHPGHIRYLKFARSLGDVLIVSVSADAFVGKGPERPFVGEELRMENLAALEFVDYVCLDHNEWAGPILEQLRPDIYVKGKEYENKRDPRFTRERDLVESYGGRVVFSSGDVVYSSTFLVNEFGNRLTFDQEKRNSFCTRHGVTSEGIRELLANVGDRKVLVVGDAIVDQYVHCDALGVASEAPVLGVTPIREQWFLGAAGLIAAQILELGAHATLLTSYGGAGSQRFEEAAAEHDLEVVNVREDARPVVVKTRYLVDETKVFKVDGRRPPPVSTQATRILVDRLSELVGNFDAVIITDFGYGLFNAALIEAIAKTTRAHGRPYYLDVSHTRRANILQFSSPRLATPTEQELRFAFADNESGLSHLAVRFFEQTQAEYLMLTLGKRGVLMFDRPRRPGEPLANDFLPALEMHAVDPVGAGDVFLAGATLADLSGASFPQGAYFGELLASLHISRVGNAVIECSALHRYASERPELAG